MARALTLPASLPPRLLSREQAAEYVGVSPTAFDELVPGTMPAPTRLGRRVLWDRHQLDRVVDRLAGASASSAGGRGRP